MRAATLAPLDDGRDSVLGETVSPVLRELAGLLDADQPTMALHATRVASHCEATARHLGMPAAHARRVALAGGLHDVGKVGVPRRVLAKPGPLNQEEWAVIREHPALGHRLLTTAGLPDIARWVLAHHERVDGRGYPRGLRGDEIPIEARIVAVADAFEAMVAERPYRAAIGRRAAVAELKAGAGTQFDAAVVDGFLQALELA